MIFPEKFLTEFPGEFLMGNPVVIADKKFGGIHVRNSQIYFKAIAEKYSAGVS